MISNFNLHFLLGTGRVGGVTNTMYVALTHPSLRSHHVVTRPQAAIVVFPSSTFLFETATNDPS